TPARCSKPSSRTRTASRRSLPTGRASVATCSSAPTGSIPPSASSSCPRRSRSTPAKCPAATPPLRARAPPSLPPRSSITCSPARQGLHSPGVYPLRAGGLPALQRRTAKGLGPRGSHGHYVRFQRADAAGLAALGTDAAGRQHGVSIPPPLIRAELIAALKRRAENVLAPPLAHLVAQTAQPLLQPIFDLQSPKIVFGRVALLGDAAFVARPPAATRVMK